MTGRPPVSDAGGGAERPAATGRRWVLSNIRRSLSDPEDALGEIAARMLEAVGEDDEDLEAIIVLYKRGAGSVVYAGFEEELAAAALERLDVARAVLSSAVVL